MCVPGPVAVMRAPARLAIAVVATMLLAACGGPATPTVRPELAWSRASMELPAAVVDVAPGSSVGMVCSPCHAEQASLLRGVVATDDGLLAVGVQLPPASAVAYRSTDGRTWVAEPGFAPGEDTGAFAVAADGGRRVIVGRRGDAAASWASVGDGRWQASPPQASLAGAEMLAVTPWGGGFVAAGRTADAGGSWTAAIWRSADGLAWDLVRSEPGPDATEATGLAANATTLVAVGTGATRSGTSAAFWVSDDGTAWERVEVASADAGPARAVASFDGGFAAVGAGRADDRAVAWTSPDGRSWAPVDSGPWLENRGEAIRMLAVGAGADGLIAAGWQSDAGNGSGVMWTSPDGRTWERVPTQASMSGGSLAGVASHDGSVVVVGTSGSPDNDQASAWYREP